jgi:RiboL-PSP-HEPN
MHFPRLDNAIAVSKKHLDATKAYGTEIESFLVAFLLVTIIAEFEERLEAIVAKRAERAADSHIQAFATHYAHVAVRSPKISDIAGVLGYFGADYKDAFQKKITNTAAHRAYDLLLTNRHTVAHRTVPNMTFVELEAAYPESVKVIDAAAEALSLTPTEIASL